MNDMTNMTVTENVVVDQLEPFEKVFIDRYVFFANKSAQNVLEMCRVVYQAHKDLKKSAFDRFCRAIGNDNHGSTISKMRKIGERYDFLKPYSDRLPSAWTTLYHLARLDEEKFAKAIEEGMITPSMGAKTISEINPRPKKVQEVQPGWKFNPSTGRVSVQLPKEWNEKDRQGLLDRLNFVIEDFYSEIERNSVEREESTEQLETVN